MRAWSRSGLPQATRTAITFLAGIALGAIMMVEIVPASSKVEISNLGVAPEAGSQAPQPGDNGGGLGDASEVPGQEGQTGAQPGPRQGTTTGTSGTTTGTATTGTATTTDGSSGSTGGTDSPAGVECAPGENGGATDQGVTGDQIRLATTVVESGIGSAFLGEVRYAMEAVKNRVNRAGGICGRALDITYVDDGWDAVKGAQYLRNFLKESRPDKQIFAIPVGPSSEGLNIVIEHGDVDTAQMPVVGTDGLIVKQYEKSDGSAQPWVWPIAAATVSSARIMAADAYERMKQDGIAEPTADLFSIVFDFNYKFGEEGAEAFNQEVRRLTGADIPGYAKGSTSCSSGTQFCGVSAGQPEYGQELGRFQPGKFVALFLEPDTAIKWMTHATSMAASDKQAVPYGWGAAQPLFTENFAVQCQGNCNEMMIWTGFKPFQEQYRSDPDVQAFVNDLRATNRDADPNNQFSLGAYIGMELLVQALEEVGPSVTRMRLKEVLDGIRLGTGLTLTDPLVFSPDNRYVSTKMQAWVIQYRAQFSGWRAEQVVQDPRFK